MIRPDCLLCLVNAADEDSPLCSACDEFRRNLGASVRAARTTPDRMPRRPHREAPGRRPFRRGEWTPGAGMGGEE